MIPARCMHTGELVNLADQEQVLIPRGLGEMARAQTLTHGEVVVQASGRHLRIIAGRRTADAHEVQHDLAELEMAG